MMKCKMTGKIWDRFKQGGHFIMTERKKDMKVIGFNGRPRNDGNTTMLMERYVHFRKAIQKTQ